MQFTGAKSSPILLLLEQRWRLLGVSMHNHIEQLTHYDETKKVALDAQITIAKENLKLSHGE